MPICTPIQPVHLIPTTSRPDDRSGLGVNVKISPKISPTLPTTQESPTESLPPPGGRIPTRQSPLDTLLRKASSPPTSPRGGGPQPPLPNRRQTRRPTPTGEQPGIPTSPAATSTKSRGITADGHIVPPIKVLIVEGITALFLSFLRKLKTS